MSMRSLGLGLLLVGVFCWFFVEWPAPKFQRGDYVYWGRNSYAGGKYNMFMVVSDSRPTFSPSLSGGKIKLIAWDAVLAKPSLRHGTFRKMPEGSLTKASKAWVEEYIRQSKLGARRVANDAMESAAIASQ